VLAYYQQLIRIRRSKRVLIFGTYRDISGPQPNNYTYVRSDDTGQIVVALNFSDEAMDLKLPSDIVVKHRVISNVPGAELALTGTLHLLPWQATIFA
jgi:oligo-1,6-glucosidase